MVNKKGFDDIELGLVLNMVRRFSLFSESDEYINYDAFTTDEKILSARYEKIDDYMTRLSGENDLDHFPSISHIFSFVKKSHQDIASSDVYLIGVFIASYVKMLSFLSREDEAAEDLIALKDEILYSLDAEGNVYENHRRLLPLRRELESAKSRRQSYAVSFMHDNQSILQGDNPLYRDQRIVIPVKAFEKNKVKGYLQGSSASGQTLFMEPLELISYNNDVVLAEERIKDEISRIKHELAEKARAVIWTIKDMEREAKDFDFHCSFAVWNGKVGAKHIRKGERIRLIDASHPLLKKAVPISITIPSEIRCVVFSGANAGGKTVTMKTIALFAALNQISSFVPAKEESELPYFDNILTDIGDGQSILSDESTFSSHLANISYVIRNTNETSLILLDELGSGTDPDEGASLALSVLDYLKDKARLTLSSSHYSKVKTHAYTTDGMMNASMAFSEDTAMPLYRVIENIPGDSHAIDAAKRMHLPKEIVENARLILSDRNESVASLISSLIKKSRTLDKKISEAELRRRKAEQREKELEEKLLEEEKKVRELEKNGLSEINSFLTDSRRTLEHLIRDIQTGTLDKAKIKSAKAFMDSIKEKEEKIRNSFEKAEDEGNDERPLSIGESVLCGKSRVRGRILEKRGKNYLVLLESGLKLTLKGSDLESFSDKKEVSLPSFSKSSKKAEYEMDLRGLTAAEAIERVEDQIEAAIISSLKSFSIIHGLGDGILMRRIHDYLKNREEVDSYYFARPEDGGMGKTYVNLKG